MLLAVILLLLSAFFSGSETAFTSLSGFQVEALAEKAGRRGKILKELFEKPNTFIATVLICNNLVNTSLSAMVTNLTIKIWGSEVLGIVTGILTLFILMFGEVTPKNVAIVWNEPIAVFIAPIFKVLSWVLTPVILFINMCSSFITKLVGNKKKETISADMLYSVIKSAADKGIIKDYEQRMLYGVFSLNYSTLKNIITHRTDVVSMDQELTLQEAVSEIDKHKFSKYPIYSGDKENITGIVRASRVINELRKGNNNKLREIKEEPLYLQDSRRTSDVFRLMEKTGNHFAVVLDEYGGFTGIVNLDDIVSLVLGELYHLEEADTEKVEKVSDNEYIIYGEAPVASVAEKLWLPNLPWDTEIRTIGGLILKKMGRIPNAHELVKIGDYTFYIEEVSDRQVLKLRYIK